MPFKAENIVRQARKYIGTPFCHQGRAHAENRRASETIDCAGLLVCVGEDLGMVDRTGMQILRADYMDRGRQELNTFLRDECMRRLDVKNASDLAPGDVVTLRAPNSISHCGIIGDSKLGPTMIFAYPVRLRGAISGRIVEVNLDKRWRARIHAAYRYPGVTD